MRPGASMVSKRISVSAPDLEINFLSKGFAMSVQVQCPHCQGLIDLKADAGQVVVSAVAPAAPEKSAADDLLDLLGDGDDDNKA